MPTRPLFAGARVRAMRKALALPQIDFARKLGVSASYLSQIETDGRPLTAAVRIALAAAFPADWREIDVEESELLLGSLVEAMVEPSYAAPAGTADALARAAQQHPELVRRLVTVHAAWRRAEEQLQRLDEAYDAGAPAGGRLPWDEVRDWFNDIDNYVGDVDEAAERLATGLGDDPDALMRALRERHGVSVRANDERLPPLRDFDPKQGILRYDPTQPPESRRFQLANQFARIELRDEIASVVRRAALRSEESTRLLGIGLANYAAGAILMPYGALRADARRLRHDIDRLRLAYGVSFEQVCHRLSTLQRPGARGIPFFFCRVDMAGNITKRHSATKLRFAQFGGACPLWVIHEAAAHPERILTQYAEMPDGNRYVIAARGLVKEGGRFDRRARRYAVAIGCDARHAPSFVYGDHLDVKHPEAATPIGMSCRTCPRQNCEQRAFPPTGRTLLVDPDRRDVVPYRF